jgi:hypothetical protein
VHDVVPVEMTRSAGAFKRPVEAYNLGDLGMKVIKTGKELDGWLSDNADNYLVRFDAVSKETGRQISDSTGPGSRSRQLSRPSRKRTRPRRPTFSTSHSLPPAAPAPPSTAARIISDTTVIGG